MANKGGFGFSFTPQFIEQLFLDLMTRLRSVEDGLRQLKIELGMKVPRAAAAVKVVKKRLGRPPKAAVEMPPVKAPEAVEAAPKRRGRKKKEAVLEVTPKRRGRKKKEVVVEAAPKRRGRKKKEAVAEVKPVEKVKKPRGRPKGPLVKKARQRRVRKGGDYFTQMDYYRPLLEVLYEHGGKVASSECMTKVHERLATVFKPGDLEPVGKTKVPRWAYLLPWARVKLVKAGLMKAKGVRKVWEISEHGTDWLQGKLDLTLTQIDRLKGVPGPTA